MVAGAGIGRVGRTRLRCGGCDGRSVEAGDVSTVAGGGGGEARAAVVSAADLGLAGGDVP